MITRGYEIDSPCVSSYYVYIFCSYMGVSLDNEWSCLIETGLVSTSSYKTDSCCLNSYCAYIFCSNIIGYTVELLH